MSLKIPFEYISPWSLKCFEVVSPLFPPARTDFAFTLSPNSTAQTKLFPLYPYLFLEFA
jgi:hypothetical protein